MGKGLGFKPRQKQKPPQDPLFAKKSRPHAENLPCNSTMRSQKAKRVCRQIPQHSVHNDKHANTDDRRRLQGFFVKPSECAPRNQPGHSPHQQKRHRHNHQRVIPESRTDSAMQQMVQGPGGTTPRTIPPRQRPKRARREPPIFDRTETQQHPRRHHRTNDQQKPAPASPIAKAHSKPLRQHQAPITAANTMIPR